MYESKSILDNSWVGNSRIRASVAHFSPRIRIMEVTIVQTGTQSIFRGLVEEISTWQLMMMAKPIT